ncbi:MAG TPA: ABC transporter ATP-binding protein [Thermomicrobiales bacterium]|nr:ABC transporter ATP-binding protein [Thermomicrobiales bacterium]
MPTPNGVPGSAAPTSRAEFTVEGREAYDHRSPLRWFISHLAKFKLITLTFLVGAIGATLLNSAIPSVTGEAFDEVLTPDGDPLDALLRISLVLLGIVIARAGFDVIARYSIEVMAKRLERDTRLELFTSLLGKSQTFHNRQKVGDLMARSTSDVRQLGFMMSPGLDLLIDSMLGLVIPIVFIGLLDWRLLLSPLVFTVFFFLTLRLYMNQLNPVSNAMRERFGILNAGLNEAVRGVEVIKATGQEAQERKKFAINARSYRDLQVAQGLIQAKYLPTLVLPITMALAVLHGVYMVQENQLTIGQLVAYTGLMGQLGFPTFISTFTFSLVQMGFASAERILGLMRAETELDQNTAGHSGEITGDVEFDHVTFGYGGEPILKDISFHAKPGETIAIVGETGSGKSTMTKLVNRTYDVTSGQILLDGIDLRDWSMDSLRSQISFIEQDVTLFSRSVAENIGFSLGQTADREEIVRAARDAQAHEFIVELENGYDTVIGERGVTLSGGQRQRLAIARALLTSPSVLVLDDSTSAIDSATEDSIQQAIRRILEGRTTLLITHRLSQIRWADRVLLLRKGELVAQGTHDELLAQSSLYRRIFAHYDEMESPEPALASSSAAAGEE